VPGPLPGSGVGAAADRGELADASQESVRDSPLRPATSTADTADGVTNQYTLRVWHLFALVLAIVAFGGYLTLTHSNGSGSSSTPSVVTTPAPTTTQWALVVRQSSCQESPSTAYVNCSIGIRNRGSTAGVPTVYAMYRYSDSGTSYDESDQNPTGFKSDPIPPGELGWVYFSHSYNAQQHDVLQVAVTLDNNAKSWPYVRIVDPSDANWPFDQGPG